MNSCAHSLTGWSSFAAAQDSKAFLIFRQGFESSVREVQPVQEFSEIVPIGLPQGFPFRKEEI